MTLTEFLLARIAEDEAAIPEGPPAPWHYATHPVYEGDDSWSMSEHHVRYSRENYSTRVADCWHEAVSRHIARHDPARVLAECEAKRRIVKVFNAPSGYEPWVLHALATVYADHPDYDEAWRP